MQSPGQSLPAQAVPEEMQRCNAAPLKRTEHSGKAWQQLRYERNLGGQTVVNQAKAQRGAFRTEQLGSLENKSSLGELILVGKMKKK